MIDKPKLDAALDKILAHGPAKKRPAKRKKAGKPRKKKRPRPLD